MAVSYSFTVNSDLSWKAYVYGHDVASKITARSPLSTIPHHFWCYLTLSSVSRPSRFQEMSGDRKGNFSSADGSTVAYEDARFSVTMNGKIFKRTIRTTNCDILVHEKKCCSCHGFRPTLRAMHSRWMKKSRSPKTPKKCGNHRFLNTPQKLKKYRHVLLAGERSNSTHRTNFSGNNTCRSCTQYRVSEYDGGE